MKKSFIVVVGLSLFASADFMDSIGDMVKSTLIDDKDSITRVESVTTLMTGGSSTVKQEESLLDSIENKTDSLVDSVVDGMKSTIGIKEKKKKKKTSIIKDSITAMKEVTGLKKIKQDNTFFDGGIMGEMASIIELEKGETLGLPSIFGINKKKQTKVFGSTVLGDTLLGDAKDTGTTFYRGFKNTGESAEFMSGMMYKSSQVYNEMFHVFDDSVFNIFEDDDKESSVFDVFETGNEVLDIFD